MSQTTCRTQFTSHDVQFIVDHLGETIPKANALERLCRDPDCLDEMLDLDPLHRALVDEPQCTAVSPAFYFYVLTRRELLRRGLDDRNLCDYVAGLLTAFTHRQTLTKGGLTESTRAFAYVSDLLQSIEQAPSAQRYSLRCFVADYSLFVSGIFKENLEARQQRGAPGVSFYEGIGQQSYRSAAAQPQALRDNVRDLLETIAECFHEVRLSLNSLTERSLHFAPAPVLLT
jgi:hypothetical protein